MPIKKCLWLLVILMIGSVGARAAAKDKTINFKYQLETGMKFGYQLSVKTATTQQVLGRVINRDEEWQIRYQITVLSGSANRGGALLRVTYDSIGYRLDSPFEQYSYRLKPDDAALPERLKPYARLIGTDFKLSLQKTPKIKVNAQKENSAHPEGFNLQQLFASFSSDALAAQYQFPNLIGNIFWAYPNAAQKYKTGASWQGASSLTNGQFAADVKTEYRIIDANTERIQVALRTPNGYKYQKEQPVRDNQTELTKMVTALAGNLAGQVEIAKASKLPFAGMIKLSLDGTVNRFGTEVPVSLQMAVRYQRL
jgi:hypothetical protein